MLKPTHAVLPILAAAFLLSPLAATAEEAPASSGSIVVAIRNLQNDRGQVGCSLYAKESGFPSDPDKASKSLFVKPKAGKASCTFTGVEPGRYAVSVMHDEDEDGELETSLVGRPKEWWGVSNDVPAERFGPPKYDKATFEFPGGTKTIEIKLQL